MTDRPGFTIIRCCQNCHYFRQDNEKHPTGICRLPLVVDKKNKPLPAHTSTVCEAHTWKGHGKTVQRVAAKLKIDPPEGTY